MLKRTLLIGTLALSACGTSGPRTFDVEIDGCGEATRLAPGGSVSYSVVSNRADTRFVPLSGQGLTEETPLPVTGVTGRIVSGADVVELSGRHIVGKKPGVAVLEVEGLVEGRRSTSRKAVLVEPVTSRWTFVDASHPRLAAGVLYDVSWEVRGPTGQPLCAPDVAFAPLPPGGANARMADRLVFEEGARIVAVDRDATPTTFTVVRPDEARLTVIGEHYVQAGLFHEGQPVALPARVRATVRTPAVCSLSRDAGPVDADPSVMVEPDGLLLRPREGVSEGRCVVALQPDPDADGADALVLEAAVDAAKLVSGAGDGAR